jgi:hypothetical protein
VPLFDLIRTYCPEGKLRDRTHGPGPVPWTDMSSPLPGRFPISQGFYGVLTGSLGDPHGLASLNGRSQRREPGHQIMLTKPLNCPSLRGPSACPPSQVVGPTFPFLEAPSPRNRERNHFRFQTNKCPLRRCLRELGFRTLSGDKIPGASLHQATRSGSSPISQYSNSGR